MWLLVFAEGPVEPIWRTYVQSWKKFGAGMWWLFAPFLESKKWSESIMTLRRHDLAGAS